MVVICPRCQRANPAVAAYCYYDGAVLRQDAAAPTAASAELVFPSGRRCARLDDLAQACQAEWDEARQLLESGDMVRYLDRLGRPDLVRAAQDARKQADPDIGLYHFVHQLPATRGGGPRLDLQPRRLHLTQLRVGEQKEIGLVVGNQGEGQLLGKVKVSEGQEWLKLADGTQQTSVRTNRDQPLPLLVDTRGLIGGQTYSGRLTVITNGGIAEVPVRLDLAAVAFRQPPYQGASSPRDLAKKMLANPKSAVPLLEKGEVSRWFAANGWSYPVEGQAASGVGAVQQFFECLGLSKPPPLALSDNELQFQCVAPQPAHGQVTLQTSTRKWVYAQVECDVPWVRVLTPSVSGPQQAAIAFEIDPSGLDGEQVHQASLQIRANAGQKLQVRLKVEVQRPKQTPANRLLRPMLAGMVLALVLRLLLAVPADIYGRLLAPAGDGEVIGGLSYWQTLPAAEALFVRRFVLATWWLGGLVGLLEVWRRGGGWTDRVCGIVAGCAAGVAVASVMACLLLLADVVPRALIGLAVHALGPNLPTAGSTALWVTLATLGWAVLGGLLGLILASAGQAGLQVLAGLGAPLAGLFRMCRLTPLVNLLTRF